MDHPSTVRNAPSRRVTRPLALLVSGALAASALVLVPTAAQADATTTVSNATLSWGFNNYASFSVGAVTGNAATDTAVSPRAFTLTHGSGQLDADGTGSIDFTGSVSYTYATPGPSFPGAYVFSGFHLDVTDGATGTLTADVSGSSTFVTAADDVVIATFGISSYSFVNGALSLATADPDYTPSTDYPNGSWPLAFMAQVTSSGKAFFYPSGNPVDPNSASNLSKKPVALTVLSPAVTASVSYPTGGGVDIAVAGTGFARLNQGVYVGVGPVGLDLNLTSDPAYQAQFLAADWITTSALGSAGTVSSTLHVDTAKLSKTGTYAVYTWNAHAHATTANDTITPVPFSYSSLTDAPAEPVTPVAVATTTRLGASSAKLVYGHSTTLTATVGSGATGTVRFSDGSKTLGTVRVSGGKAVLTTSKTLLVGTHSIVARYSGDSTHRASTSSALKVAVSKAAIAVKIAGSSYSRGHAPVVKLALGALPSGEKASGRVQVRVNGKVVKTGVVTSGKIVKVTLAKSWGSKKSITVSVRFLGSTKAIVKTSKTITLRVKR